MVLLQIPANQVDGWLGPWVLRGMGYGLINGSSVFQQRSNFEKPAI